jgi:CheY-like chemotaxis protein
MIQRNIELEARLIDDLLDLTRISRGKLHLTLETLPLGPLIARTLNICQADIAGKQLQVETDLSAAECFVRGDHARLQQILWNLIKNAVKFTPQQGFLKIWAEQAPDRRILIRVRDTGIGIPLDTLPRIFTPFDQGGANTAKTYGGLGLGLAISKALAELQGGLLLAHSDGPNCGSTFTLNLPVVEAPRQVDVSAAQNPAAPVAQRILLVEDHDDTARIMGRLLTNMGHQVAIAHDVMSALRRAETEKFDLLISDIGLPDGSGVQLMRELRKHSALRGIALSGYGMEDDVRECKDAGFAEHLTKPVNLQTLERAINHLAPQTP